MSDSYEAKEIKAAFIILCKKCGSENVVIDIEEGHNYGGQTGYSGGHLSIGCNDCAQNDVLILI